MKKVVTIFALFAFLVIPTVFALNLDVQKVSSNDVIIVGSDQPATFNMQITNSGSPDNLIFYTYFTSTMFPKGTTPIGSSEKKMVELQFYPPEGIKPLGYQTFEYFIKGQNGDEQKETATINAIELSDAFEIGSDEINVGSQTMTIYIHNKVNKDFKNLSVEFSSPFFTKAEEFSLDANQRKNFVITLNSEDFKKLMAGFYTMSADIKFDNLKTTLEAPIKFVEKDVLTESKKSYGFIINTQIITKTNEGNTVSNTQAVMKKNIISRLFTTFSPEPDTTERHGFVVYYTWNQKINPGDAYEIKVKTNWLFPFVLVLLIVAVAVLTKYYSNRNLVLKKRVSFIRTKGGEFALKVSVIVDAKSYIEKVNVTERLPPLVKLHERFGPEAPSRIDEKNRRIEWRFNKLEEGEKRVLSYILYSKIGVVGKFALPRTTAIFEKEGKILERNSNKAFFVIEQASVKDFE